MSIVSSSVREPNRAAAEAASHPACPPPMTIDLVPFYHVCVPFEGVEIDHIHFESGLERGVKCVKTGFIVFVAESKYGYLAYGIHDVYLHPVDTRISGRCPETIMRGGDALGCFDR